MQESIHVLNNLEFNAGFNCLLRCGKEINTKRKSNLFTARYSSDPVNVKMKVLYELFGTSWQI